KLLHVDAKKLWPPALDHVSVDKGYEAALGAALGDDLEAPIDPSAPMRWAGAAIDAADPALPDGVQALGDHVKAPKQLARRRAKRRGDRRKAGRARAPAPHPRPARGRGGGRLGGGGGFRGGGGGPGGGAPPLGGKEPPRRYRGRAQGRAARDRNQAEGGD